MPVPYTLVQGTGMTVWLVLYAKIYQENFVNHPWFLRFLRRHLECYYKGIFWNNRKGYRYNLGAMFDW